MTGPSLQGERDAFPGSPPALLPFPVVGPGLPRGAQNEEGLIAQQRDRQIEEDSRRRENEERVVQYNYFAASRESQSGPTATRPKGG